MLLLREPHETRALASKQKLKKKKKLVVVGLSGRWKKKEEYLTSTGRIDREIKCFRLKTWTCAFLSLHLSHSVESPWTNGLVFWCLSHLRNLPTFPAFYRLVLFYFFTFFIPSTFSITVTSVGRLLLLAIYIGVRLNLCLCWKFFTHFFFFLFCLWNSLGNLPWDVKQKLDVFFFVRKNFGINRDITDRNES